MAAEVEIYQPPRAELAVPPEHDIDSWLTVCQEVIKLANVIYDTPFVPEGLRGSGPAVAACILAGREMGLGPMTSLQNIHVIKGKPGQSALLMRSLIQSKGHDWEDVDVSDVRVVVRGRRKGSSTWTEASFTAQQARLAGIDLGKYPQDKLYARASVRLARRKFADVIMGMPYSEEELSDGDADGVAVAEVIDHTAAPAEIEPPKAAAAQQRPVQRRQNPRQERPDPAPAAAPADSAPGPDTPTARPAAPSSDLPPLPGEDDPAEPAVDPPATGGQVGIIQSHFSRLGFGGDEPAQREPRLIMAAQLAGRSEAILSTKDLTQQEAARVADTLSRCKDRDKLLALLDSGDKP